MYKSSKCAAVHGDADHDGDELGEVLRVLLGGVQRVDPDGQAVHVNLPAHNMNLFTYLVHVQLRNVGLGQISDIMPIERS